jgi:hypothetical protein
MIEKLEAILSLVPNAKVVVSANTVILNQNKQCQI